MRKNMSWTWEKLSHQGTSAPSIGGLAWDSKPHVPRDEWLLVTNKSSFGNPKLSTLMSQDPNQSKLRDVQRMCFVLFYLLAGGWAFRAHIFAFFVSFWDSEWIHAVGC